MNEVCNVWEKLGHGKSILTEKWPKVSNQGLGRVEFEILVQVNGKLRDRIKTGDVSQANIENLAKSSTMVQNWLKDKVIKKTVYVNKRLINFVVE